MEESPPCAWNDVANGTATQFMLPVVAQPDGGAVELPVLVAHGIAPGKILLVTAGVHGDEFEGVAAIRILMDEMQPYQLSGTVVAVPVANPPAYGAGLRTNAEDRQDMARIFPGDPHGTVTERLAWTLTHRFICHADFYCDLHSAGRFNTMPPLVGYQLRDEPLLTQQRDGAKAFGMPIIWGTAGLPGRSLSAAGDHGVPAIYAEITGGGQCRTVDVQTYLDGLRRLLAHLGIISMTVFEAPPVVCDVEDDRHGAGFLQMQNRAAVGGFFEPVVQVMDRVQKGQPIGVLRDLLGRVQCDVQATHTGLVIFLRMFPRVHAGDPLCTVLELGDQK